MQARKLEKGVGYVAVYCSESMKIELSANGTVLRWTVVQKGIPYEYLYEQVTDPACISAIEDKSVNWKLMDVRFSKSHYVIGQANAENKYTGNIKIVNKSRAVVKGFMNHTVAARQEDFSYYVKRKR